AVQVVERLFTVARHDDLVGEIVFLQRRQGELNVFRVVLDDQDASQVVHDGLLLCFGNREIESRAAIQLSFSPHSASVTVDDALNGREAYAGALEFLGTVETLEYAEQLAHISHVEPDPVVLDANHDLARCVFHGSDLDLGPSPRARELHRVGDEVDHRDPQQGTVATHVRQGADSPVDLTPVRVAPHLTEGVLDDQLEADGGLLDLATSHSRKGQQVIDQGAHPFRRFPDHQGVAPALLVQD